MATIRQIRKQIKSTKNIAKITRAMQMVAASKMKKAQEQAQASREYAMGISDLSYALAQKIDQSLHPLLQGYNAGKKELVVLVAPEKGLCGSLVTNLARVLAESYPDLSLIDFIAVGRKAKSIIIRLNGNLIAEFLLGISQPKYELVPPIAAVISQRFLAGDISRVVAIYTNFINTMVQRPAKMTLLPLQLIKEDKAAPPAGYYIFEPSAERLAEALLPMYLEIEIYQLLLEAYASEQSARMVAMKNATDNANSLLQALTQGYNKARQAGITSEIIDIATASAVLSD